MSRRFPACLAAIFLFLAPNLQGSSPADDPADPVIVAKATALGKDPAKIYAFVRDEVGFAVYPGSVRGARGTLADGAGNALDRASLLVALLGASGVPSRYVQGTLAFADAQKIVDQMLPAPLRALGCPPSSVPRFNPVFSNLPNEIYPLHYWVEYGAGNTPMDPSLRTNAAGTAIGTAGTRFTEIPENLRQKVTVRLVAETYSQAGALFGFGQGSTAVLTKELTTAELYGRPLSAGHFVTTAGLAAATASAKTYTYSPYLLIGDPNTAIDRTALLTGTDYVEAVTNFPLSSTVLTGIFLEIDALDSTQTKKTYRHTILDRIGPNFRVTGGTLNVTVNPSQGPAVTDADITTVHVLAGRQPLDTFALIQSRLTTAQNQLTPLIPAITTITGQQTPLTPAQLDTLRTAGALSRQVAIATNELAVSSMAGASDRFLGQLETTISSRSWYGTPRLIVSATRYDGTNASVSMNLLKRDLTWYGVPGQNTRARIPFEILRGQMDSALEGKILAGVTGGKARSIDRVFAALASRDEMTFFGPANADYLRTTGLSAAAKARISEAVAGNKFVITPRNMVTLDGQSTVAWYETDPATGETVSTFEDGTHGAFAEYVAGQLIATYTGGANGNFIGKMHGIGQAGVIFAAGVLNGIANSAQFAGDLKATKDAMGPVTESLYFKVKDTYDVVNALIGDFIPIETPDSVTLLTEYVAGFKDGFELGRDWFSRFAGVDPLVPSYLTRDMGPGPAAIAPGGVPGVKMTVTPDPLSFVRRGAEELATVFTVRLQNTGPVANTFNLAMDVLPPGFNPTYGLDRFVIPAGQTAETSLCMYPNGKLPAAGAPIAFTPAVRDQTNAVSDVKPQQFAMPVFGTVDGQLAPASKALVAGQSTTTDFSITSVGNLAQGTIDVAATVPSGLTLNGLSTPVNLTPGQTVVQALTIGTAGNLTPGTRVGIPIRISWGPAGARQSITRTFVAAISSPGTQCVRTSTPKATNAGRTNLGAVLRDLANLMDELALNPSDGGKKAEVVTALDTVLAQLNVAPIDGVKPALQTARDGLAAASAGGVTAALVAVGNAMCALDTALQQFPSGTFETFPAPNSQVAIAGTPATFTIFVQNKSARPRTFRVAAGVLPAGVTATFTTTEFTIEANTDTNNSSMFGFIVPRVQVTAAAVSGPFNFDVIVTPVDAPSTAKTITMGLTPRAEFVVVDNVVAIPGSGPVGTPMRFSARVFNAVNQARTVNATYRVKNKAGQVYVFDRFAAQVNLTQTAALTTFTLATPFDTTGYPEGAYTIEVTLADANANLGVLNPTLGTGTFFLGPPISGELTVTPNTLPPQGGVVTAKLQINRETAPTPLATLLGSVATTSRAQGFARSGNLAYVCGDKAITIVDVSDPANLVVKGTFGQTQLGATGYAGTPCTIANNHLFVSYGRENGNTTANFLPTNISSYNLANPLAPVFVSTTQIQRQDPNGIQSQGTTGYSTTQGFFYNPFSRFIFQFHGQYYTLDLSNPATPAEAGALFPATPGLDPRLGSPNPVYAAAQINATTVLLAMSTTNQDPATGVGRALIVDISNAAAPTIKATLDIPGTRLVYSAAVQGNTAVLLGDTLGYYDALSGLTGTMTITSLDLSNSNAPVVKQTVTTQLNDKDFASVIPISGNQFVAGGATLGGDALLLLIDASTPTALRYVPYKAAVPVFPTGANGNYFYTLSTAGLSTYQLSFINGPQLTAKIQVPKGTGVAAVAGSFTPAPTAVTPGASFDTYEFQQPASDTITFTLNVTGLSPGTPKTVLSGGSLEFTLPSFGAGTFPLPPVTVVTDHVLSIDPGEKVANPLETASYTLTIKNPTAASQTYAFTVTGIPAAWVTVPAPVTLAAGAQTTAVLGITPDKQALAFGVYPFAVTAKSAAVEGSAFAGVRLNSLFNTGGNNNSASVRPFAILTPALLTVGRGTSATVDVTIENSGNVADNSSVFVTGFAGGLGGQCTPNGGIVIQPGQENRRTVQCRITAAPFVAPGTTPYSAVVGSFGPAQVLTGNIQVAPQGVTVALTKNAQTANRYDAEITNTGTAQDTFTLALYGPFAPVSTLGSGTVALAPGATQTVPVTLAGLTGFAPGSYELRVGATSQANPAVLNSAVASIVVGADATTLVALDPGTTTVASAPATANLVLAINNTGNVSQSYEVSVLSATAPLAAALANAQATMTVTVPAFGLAQVPVQATLAASGSGTVTMRVKPVAPAAPEILVSAKVETGTVVTPPVDPPPVDPPPVTPPSNVAPIVNAGADREIPLRQKIVLDGSGSSDPDNGPQALVYSWTLLNKPAGSQVAQASLTNANTVKAGFSADVFGTYTFRLTVSDGKDVATKDLTLQAVNYRPVANPGPTVTTALEKAVVLDGTESYDPDNDRITFQWVLLSAPEGSRVTGTTPSWSPRPYVIADKAGDYVFRLVVRDQLLESVPKDVTVRAVVANVPPMVFPGRSERPARVNEEITILPTARDLDGPSAVRWTVTARPVNPSAIPSLPPTVNAVTGETQFRPNSVSKFVLTFSAFDGVSTGTADLIVNALEAGAELPPYGNTVVLAAPPNKAVTMAAPFAVTGFETQRTVTYRPPGSTLLNAGINNAGTFTPDATGVYVTHLTEANGRFDRVPLVTVVGTACDADLDGLQTAADAELIRRFIGDTPLPGLDPRDANRDGKIDQTDVTMCTPVQVPVEVPSPPYLGIDPKLIEFTWQRGTPLPGPKTIFVEGDVTEYQTSVSGRGIVQVTPRSGTLPIHDKVTVTLLSAVVGLPAGRYEDTVFIGSSRTGTLQARVVLTVTETPQLLVSQQPIVFRQVAGWPAPERQLLYVTSTVRPVEFSVEVAEGNWLQANPNRTQAPANITVRVNPFGLAPGTYTGRLRVASTDAGNSPKDVPITLIVE